VKTIFLTHNLEQLDRPALHKLFSDLMFSVEPCYNRCSKYVNFRRQININRIAYDSGGFAFLLGKIREPPNPKRTCQIYRLLGYTEWDFLVQLDLPPQYYMPREERIQLIKKSAEYYWMMHGELNTDRLLGVVHGWTEDELHLSLKLLEDPDELAVGCNFSTMKPYAHDYIQKRIALGSYNVKTVLAEKIVATPSCLSEMKGLCPAGAPSISKTIALGSYAGTKNSIAWSKKKSNKVLQRVPKNVVFERLCVAMNMLRNREVFVLGGSGPNTAHLLFLLGGMYVDGASWRLAAKLWRIYVPGLGEFSVGRKKIAKRLNDEAIEVMKEHFNSSPLNTITFQEFLKKITSETKNFEWRALWNAYVLKIEEQIANQYANDPESYYKYLKKRWSNSPYWRKILEYCWRRTIKPYVQTKLTVFIKSSF